VVISGCAGLLRQGRHFTAIGRPRDSFPARPLSTGAQTRKRGKAVENFYSAPPHPACRFFNPLILLNFRNVARKLLIVGQSDLKSAGCAALRRRRGNAR
jgi:hypothetical protein